MSTDEHTDGGEDSNNKRVVDEEGTVDSQIKSRILNARERIDKAEQALFVDAVIDGGSNLNQAQQLHGFSTIVRQYIRNLRPLLTSDEIEQANYYWKQVSLFEGEFPPPDTESHAWSQFVHDETDNIKLKRSMDLSPNFDPPESKHFAVTGLHDVLEKQGIEMHWRVDKKQGSSTIESDVDNLSIARPLPKSVYESAVEYADEFLQEAGIGLEIGHQQIDDNDTDPF